MHRNLQ